MGRLNDWLLRAGVDPKWYRAVAARKKRDTNSGDLPMRVLNDSSPAAVVEAATTLEPGVRRASDENGKEAAPSGETSAASQQGGSQTSGNAEDRSIWKWTLPEIANRHRMVPVLRLIDGKCLPEQSSPNDSARPVRSSGRHLRSV